MSAPAAVVDAVTKIADKLAGLTGTCGVCTCDRYEHGGRKDGFDTCVCLHTKWSHARES